MQVRVQDRRTRYILFFLIALTINVIDGALTRSIVDARPRMLMAIGASFDVVFVVTGLYYWLLIRPGIRTRWSLIPIAMAGVLHATYMFPHAAAERAILAEICELSLIGFVVVRVRRVIRRDPSDFSHTDPVQAIRETLAAVFLFSPMANICATELAVLYYALLSWRAKPDVPFGAKEFSIHRRTTQPDILFLLAVMTLVEILPLHLLLSHWSPVWAWIATGLGLYAAIWLIGLARSIELRPALIGVDYLDLRYGLLFRARIPGEVIRAVRRIDENDVPAAAVVLRRGKPNLCIEFSNPIDAEGPFGLRKRISRVAFTADDVARFEQVLNELMRAN
jgi:hypothetical protein